MEKNKKITNEDLLKEIVALKKQVEENRMVVPYIPFQPIVVSPPCHHHCHPIYSQPYSIMMGNNVGLQSAGHLNSVGAASNILNQLGGTVA